VYSRTCDAVIADHYNLVVSILKN